MTRTLCPFRWLLLAVLASSGLSRGAAGEEWVTLLGEETTSLAEWREPQGGWRIVGDAALPLAPQPGLAGKSGRGVLLSNGSPCERLYSRAEFTDVEIRLEFMLGRDSNSGVKLNGLYEIQFLDSFGKTPKTGDFCGGIYPRAVYNPLHTYIDDGTPPRVNSAKPAGEWQLLELAFRSPRFDADGKKTSPALFEWVKLNGELLHEQVEVQYPTGAAWNEAPEVPAGPLMLQGDHGPVAFRNVRVRALEAPPG